MSQTINVDMTPNSFQPSLYYSQGDIGREFKIKIVSQSGDTIPAGATVTIQATKPSGFGFSVAADSVTDGVATFTTTAVMTDEFGRFPAELKVVSGSVTIFSANFQMVGERNTHPEGTIDGQQGTIIPELTVLVERVEAAASSVLDMTVNATTLAAGSQATYSYDEDTNTATFGIPQGEAGAGAAGVVASAYSASKTYAVGDYVIHNSNLYRCTTAITTAEAFTAAHWTQVVLGDDVTDLKSALSLAFDMGSVGIITPVQANYGWVGDTNPSTFKSYSECISFWFYAKKGVRYHFEASNHTCFGIYAFPKFDLANFPTKVYGTQILQNDTLNSYDYLNEDYDCFCFYVRHRRNSDIVPTVSISGEYVSSVVAEKADISADSVGKEVITEYTPLSGFIYDTGAVDTTASEYNRTSPIAVSAGDSINFSCACYADTAALAFSEDGVTWTCVLKGLTHTAIRDYSYTFAYDGYASISYRCDQFGLSMSLVRYSSDGLIRRMDEVEKIANGNSAALGATVEVNYSSVDGYITVDGTESTGGSYGFKRTLPIQVYQGDSIEFSLGGYYDSPALSFKSSLSESVWTTLLNGTFSDITGTSDFEYTFTEDGYIVLSYYATYGLDMTLYHLASKGLFTKVEALSNAVDAINVKTVIMNRRYSAFKDFGEQPPANGTSGSFCNMSQGYDQLLADVYEPLRTAYPNYITRENVGKDASGTYDMYIYTFEPRYYQQSILLVAGIHANEPDAIASLARIMQLICTSDDEDLKFIRENVKVTVIPCVNVWGFSQSPKVRKNADGVEIQTQWNATNPIAEVANLRPKILALKDELSFIQDMHTTTNNTYLDFYGVINKNDKNVRTLFRTVAWLCEQYAKDGRTVDDQYLGYLDGWAGLLSNYFFKEGITTSTMELSDYYWDSSLSTSTVITMGVTMFLNYIIQQINDFYISMYDIPEEDYRPSRP